MVVLLSGCPRARQIARADTGCDVDGTVCRLWAVGYDGGRAGLEVWSALSGYAMTPAREFMQARSIERSVPSASAVSVVSGM
jgi:hypothetical protein